MLLVFYLLGGPHDSGYIYLLPQSSPLLQCSTATTCTISKPSFVVSNSGQMTCVCVCVGGGGGYET